MAEVKYIVRRRFKYGKAWLRPGDEFVPEGGRFDDAILHSMLVRPSTEKYRAKQRVGPRRRNARHLKVGQKAYARMEADAAKAEAKRKAREAARKSKESKAPAPAVIPVEPLVPKEE